jgi:hypothetical protein
MGASGAEGLRQWVLRHYTLFQAAYREHIRTGGSRDSVMWGMPIGDSLDNPPVAIAPYSRAGAKREIITGIPNTQQLHNNLDTPATPGRFYVVASRGEGRFKGTFIGMLPIPAAGDELPEAFAATLPDAELN